MDHEKPARHAMDGMGGDGMAQTMRQDAGLGAALSCKGLSIVILVLQSIFLIVEMPLVDSMTMTCTDHTHAIKLPPSGPHYQEALGVRSIADHNQK
jgi:hypothetical protein